MSFASKYNRGYRFNYQLPEGAPFKKCEEMFKEYGEKVHMVRGMYISTSGKYGDAPVIILTGKLVNAPAHLLDTVKAILKDDESIADINAGKVGCKFYSYEKDGKTRYSLTWTDIKTYDDDMPF